MRYFTADEIKNTNRKEVTEVLKGCAGKNVKYYFGIKVFKKYSDFALITHDAKILDLGTASGAFTKQLYNLGYKNIFAHDIDNYLPNEVKEIVKEYKLSDLSTEKNPWDDNFFDAITAWCVLPHLENPFHCARELWRVLKPGGIFMFTTPHILSKPSMAFFLKKKYFAGYRPTNNHIALLPLSILEKTIFRGFELIGIEYLVTPKVNRGAKGKLRKLLIDLSKYNKWLKKFLEKRWAYNICYIIRKI
ncbi:MAG: class I SAM-dependent methyltransferase [Patescibacteria group bacterium]